MRLMTLCYIEKDGCYLMLHRVKKKVDVNKDKWIGVGGHFEKDESPEECLLREVKEETGLTLTSYQFRGIVTFLCEGWETEYMCLYTADGFTGELSSCDEGTLEWIPINKISELNLWEGDRIFFRLLNERTSFFSLKLQYRGDVLIHAELDGKPLERGEYTSGKKLPYNLFLIGFMGTGKSTVARKLGSMLSRTVLEMDETIEREQRMPISEIFSRYGEPFFRNLETQLLVRTQEREDLVVSCGGGVVLRSENIAEMKKNGAVILLTASPETILQRVRKDDSRPLLRGRKTADGIAQLMDARKAAYQAAADITIATDGKNVSQIAEEILTLLGDKHLFTTC